jgi:phage-related tail fiber protein
MANEVIDWEEVDMYGWTKYVGNSQTFGLFVVEKEDTNNYLVWLNEDFIGNADSVLAAKSIAARKANSL